MAWGSKGCNEIACVSCAALRAEAGSRPSSKAVRPALSRLPYNCAVCGNPLTTLTAPQNGGLRVTSV